VKRKYLLLLLVSLVIALAGCGKKHFAPPPEPGAPSNLTATAVSYKQIHLSWQDNSDDEDYFRVLCPTMWGTQYQTVATLPPDTTSFEHYNLQPMTEYEYYVCVYRGEEHTCSNTAYATTPCPVEILGLSVGQGSQHMLEVSGYLSSNATESCQVEITARFYHPDTGELIGIATPMFHLGPVSKYHPFSFRVYLTTEHGVLSPDHTVEITSVEIEY